MEETRSSLLQLTEWLNSVGIWWDQSLVQIRGGCSNCSGPALGVFAVSDVQENQLLCVIPRSAILSPRTTQLAQVKGHSCTWQHMRISALHPASSCIWLYPAAAEVSFWQLSWRPPALSWYDGIGCHVEAFLRFGPAAAPQSSALRASGLDVAHATDGNFLP
jgi:hypothetical protein